MGKVRVWVSNARLSNIVLLDLFSLDLLSRLVIALHGVISIEWIYWGLTIFCLLNFFTLILFPRSATFGSYGTTTLILH
jgi:hypothetical protein